MIYFLSTKEHQFSIVRFLQSWGRPLNDKIKPLSYDELFALKWFRSGSYIFADLDRLTPQQTETAAAVWNGLTRLPGTRLYNHPVTSMRRFELLRHLYEVGINNFDAYRLTDARSPKKFPVFVREEEHGKIISPLIQSAEDLQLRLEEFSKAGKARENKMLIEFTDVADSEGIHLLYSAYIVGKKVIPAEVSKSRNWITRTTDPDFYNEIDEFEQSYIHSCPHESIIRPIFEEANIQYGRMDYAMKGKAPIVFEINLNPSLPFVSSKRYFEILKAAGKTNVIQAFCKNLIAAFEELDSVSSSGGKVRIPVRRVPRIDTWSLYGHRLVYKVLKALRLLRYERDIICLAKRLKRLCTYKPQL